LTHDELEDVQLRGSENDDLWKKYRTLKQDSDQIATLWQAWSAETRQALQKRMRRSFDGPNYPARLESLAADPGRGKGFLSLAKADLEPFIDAIRKDNRRLASIPECATFCLKKAVREAAAAELSQLQPPNAQATAHSWKVKLHGRFLLETEKWPPDVRDEFREKCDLLEERGSQLNSPLVKPVAGTSGPRLTRLRLGGGYRIIFARDGKNFFLLAGGKKRGLSDDRFYQGMKETATSRYRGSSK